MAVPFVDLKKQYYSIRHEMDSALKRVVDSQSFILGREVEDFEKVFSVYCNAKHAIGVSSGSDALIAALMALEVGPGDEVITSPFTFFATAGAIHRLGAKPVFADIDPETFNLDATQVNQQITDATKAVIAVHLFGQCADMKALLEVCGDIPIIEDAAQSVGAEAYYLDGHPKRTGSIGKMATFSFFPAKNLGCFGDGGAVTTDDDELAERIRRLRNHGQTARYEHQEVGGNFRLDAIQAAILQVKLRHLDDWTKEREWNASEYMASNLGNLKDIVLPESYQPRHVWNQFVVRVLNNKRDHLRHELKKCNIASAVYYPKGLHQQPCFAHLNQGPFPETERACDEVLALPVFPEMNPQQQREVIEAVVEIMEF